MAIQCVVALLLVALASAAGPDAPVSLTGQWRLNVEKSRWGSDPKPLSVVLSIEHNEPFLKYSGSVQYVGEENRELRFDGAIDGKPYPMTRSFGSGSAVLRRVSATAFNSVFRTSDGTYVETARTSISQDGRRLIRSLRLRTKDGTRSRMEVYDRQ